jgi:hypothetical protein
MERFMETSQTPRERFELTAETPYAAAEHDAIAITEPDEQTAPLAREATISAFFDAITGVVIPFRDCLLFEFDRFHSTDGMSTS